MKANQTLETITGDLRAYNQLVPGTFQHVDQLTEARLTDLRHCNYSFYPADGALYKCGKSGSLLWGIVRERDNLILKYLYDSENSSFWQLVSGEWNFCPGEKESAQAFKQADVFDLATFRLSSSGYSTHRFLRIRTADGYVDSGKRFVPPNSEEKKALLRCGFTEEYLGFLAENSIQKINKTRLYVLTPEYVRKEAEGETIWQVSWLSNFYLNSDFVADDRDISERFRLRGVSRRVAASESEPKGAAGAEKITLPTFEQMREHWLRFRRSKAR